MLASIGWALDPYVDSVALHYRHLSVSILRQLRLGRNLEDVILDRARGHVVSKLDPVTGGVRTLSFPDIDDSTSCSGEFYLLLGTLCNWISETTT